MVITIYVIQKNIVGILIDIIWSALSGMHFIYHSVFWLYEARLAEAGAHASNF